MRFNEKLICLRKQRGYTQEALAEVLGVSRQAVSRWEAGETTPEMSLLRDLCRTFDISADYLINDSIERPSDIPAVQAKDAEIVLIKADTRTLVLVSAVCFIVGWTASFAGLFLATSPVQLLISILATCVCAGGATYQLIRYAKMK